MKYQCLDCGSIGSEESIVDQESGTCVQCGSANVEQFDGDIHQIPFNFDEDIDDY